MMNEIITPMLKAMDVMLHVVKTSTPPAYSKEIKKVEAYLKEAQSKLHKLNKGGLTSI